MAEPSRSAVFSCLDLTHISDEQNIFLEHIFSTRVFQQSHEVGWVCCRARSALKAVSVWLVVPWSKVASFEVLLAHQAAATELDQTALQPSAAQTAARWAKIGAATAGAGALFAITGDS